MGELVIRAVKTRADREAFLRVPWRIHERDPNWVAPLLLERREHFSPKNPFFAHAEAQFWVAWRNGAPVGRISAQIDRLHVERYGRQGHFGFLEAADDPEVFAALLGAAEDWLHARDMEEALGPASFSANDEYGLLVEGFDGPAKMLMNYAPPYYARRLEAAGYAKAQDLLAYSYDVVAGMPPLAARMAAKAAANPRVRLRRFDMKKMREEIGVVVDIFNDAWSNNWGFVPMTEAEVDHMAVQMRPLLRPELAWIAELDSRPVAMIICLPDLHEALRGLNGRLLPFGALRLLWRLKVAGLKSARVLMMGVRRELQDSFLSGALAYALIENLARSGRKLGMVEAELSWVLEDNPRMRRIIENAVGDPYRRYRIYRKMLNGMTRPAQTYGEPS